ncbi:MAG: hypothetical protein K0V04_42565 [Deltaproteobacteria bacterium]|nr:hypothetical protein [Deltaproteobacteria bacterium]
MAQVEPILRAGFGCEVSIDQSHIDNDHLVLVGVTIAGGPVASAPPLLTARRIEFDRPVSELIEHGLGGHATVDGGSIHLALDERRSNVPAMQAPLDLEFSEARVEVQVPGGSTAIEVDDLDLTVTLSPAQDDRPAQALVSVTPASIEVAGLELSRPALDGWINADGTSSWTATAGRTDPARDSDERTMNASFAFETRDDALLWTLHASVGRWPLGEHDVPLLTRVFPLAAGSDSLEGELQLTVDLTGRGLRPDAIERDLAGSVRARVPGLELPLDSLLGRLGRHAGVDVQTLRIYGLDATATVADGWIDYRVSAADGDLLPFVGRSSLDGALELTVDLAPALALSDRALANNVEIGGTLDRPAPRF